MRLTEEQLKTIIAETAKKVLKEYAYHEKQNKPSEEEHAEWLRKKSESKKKYMDSQKKEDDGGAIDHYDYKHGKGNFPVMAKESRVRMSAKDFQKFITESVNTVHCLPLTFVSKRPVPVLFSFSISSAPPSISPTDSPLSAVSLCATTVPSRSSIIP